MEPLPSATLTVTVDLTKVIGPVTHVASGGLEGLAIGPMPPNNLVAPLHPKVFTQAAEGTSHGLNPIADALKVAPLAAAAGAKVEMRLADAIDSYPYQWPGWTQWLALIDQMVSARLSASTITNIEAYELWNEPNLNWDAAAGTFDDWWVRTFNYVRTLDKTTPIVGPSWNSWNEGLMRAFLTNAKANNTMPDYISWHELQGSARIPGDVAAYRALETSLGIAHLPISVNEYARAGEEGIPGDLVGYIAQFERAGVDHACLGNWWPPSARSTVSSSTMLNPTARGGSTNGMAT
jgi:hypothetical protein